MGAKRSVDAPSITIDYDEKCCLGRFGQGVIIDLHR